MVDDSDDDFSGFLLGLAIARATIAGSLFLDFYQ